MKRVRTPQHGKACTSKVTESRKGQMPGDSHEHGQRTHKEPWQVVAAGVHKTGVCESGSLTPQ